MSPVVELSVAEFAAAVDAARLRMTCSENLNHAKTYKRSYIERLDQEVIGVCAEIAFAKWKDIFWLPGLNVFHHQGDVSEVEVRGTRRDDGKLIIRDNDHDHRFFVLGTGNGQVMTLRGYMKAREAKQDKYLWNPNGHRASWFVPQADLLPMPEREATSR